MAYVETRTPKLNARQASSRVKFLLDLNHVGRDQRDRVRRIMNGGRDGAVALMGKAPSGTDLPFANLMLSGVERLAGRIGNLPDVRCDVPQDKDSERAQKAADKRERIVAAYDERCDLALKLRQAARWLIGYGYVPFIVKERIYNGYSYPHLALRDPFDCFPGTFGDDQQPRDLCFLRRVELKVLLEDYPHAAAQLVPKRGYGTSRYVPLDEAFGAHTPNSGAGPYEAGGRWENDTRTGIDVAEYWCDDGMYFLVPDKELILDYYPNPTSRPLFYVAKRFAFDALQGQFDHMLGLLSSMAKMQIMSVIAMEDAVFAPTVVSGQMEGTWRTGRHAINFFEQGTQVTKVQSNLPYQMFQEQDRLERYARLMGGYPAASDGESPAAWATGRGLEELRSGTDQDAREKQLVLQRALEHSDAVRLELDQASNGERVLPLEGHHRDASYSEKYIPARDIKGNYRTRRVYGLMAGWDEPSKIVTGLQLLQARVVDTRTLQENVAGLENITQVRERIWSEQIEAAAMAGLQEAVNQGDPRAFMAVKDLVRAGELKSVMEKYYSPEGEEMSPEEQAMAGMLQQPEIPATPPPIATVLSQLSANGGTKGGVQTVGRLPGQVAA